MRYIEATTLSIVVPVLDEAGNLERLYEGVVEAVSELGMAWELLFVDDGSSDETWVVIEALHRRDPRVRGMRFTRNFGHQYALFAGLTAASGDAIVSMDGDLQHPPSRIPELVERWRAGFQIVHTKRIDSGREPRLKRWCRRVFYRVFAFLSGTELEGMADFRLLDRVVVEKLARLREDGLFLRGLVQWVGFDSTKVEFVCEDRYYGTTKYSLRRMLRLAWHGTTSFSLVPLRVGIAIGVVTSLLSFAYLAFAVGSKLFGASTVPGWTSAVGIVSFLFGILFILLGVLGEYIGRIHADVRGRPRFLVRETIGLAGAPSDGVESRGGAARAAHAHVAEGREG